MKLDNDKDRAMFNKAVREGWPGLGDLVRNSDGKFSDMWEHRFFGWLLARENWLSQEPVYQWKTKVSFQWNDIDPRHIGEYGKHPTTFDYRTLYVAPPAPVSAEPVVMNDAPERIYLVIEDGGEAYSSFANAREQADLSDGIKWCEDRFSDSDVPYVRADLIAPAAPLSDAKDAERWREALMHIGAMHTDSGASRFTLRYLCPVEGSNIMKGSAAGHFTAAIDAAHGITKDDNVKS